MLQFSTGRGTEGRGGEGCHKGKRCDMGKVEMKKKIPRPADFVPEERFGDDFHDSRKRGGRRCIAWNRNAGRQCEVRATRGQKACHIHGGKFLCVSGKIFFKHGRVTPRLRQGEKGEGRRGVIKRSDMI